MGILESPAHPFQSQYYIYRQNHHGSVLSQAQFQISEPLFQQWGLLTLPHHDRGDSTRRKHSGKIKSRSDRWE